MDSEIENLYLNPLIMVGVARLELAASWSRTKHSYQTELHPEIKSHWLYVIPISDQIIIKHFYGYFKRNFTSAGKIILFFSAAENINNIITFTAQL